MNRAPLYWLCGVLAVIGSAFFLYKWLSLGYPVVPGTSADLWQIEIRIGFTAKDKPIKASLYVPGNTRNFAILNENFISRGFGLSMQREDGNRRAVWSIRTANGPQSLYYRATVEKFTASEPASEDQSPPEPRAHKFEGAEYEVAKSIVQEAQQQSADLDTLVAQLVRRAANANDDNMSLLLKGDDSLRNRISIVSRLLALAYAPARTIHGLHMDVQRREADVQPWLQVFNKDHWESYDPQTGQPGLPDNYLVFWHGQKNLLEVAGGENAVAEIAVLRVERAAVEAAAARTHFMSPVLEGMSLSSLPLSTQKVYEILLLVPVGAFLLVIMRNVVGIKTFGTFMPVLIALSFRETQLTWGIVLFTLVVSLGLILRFSLERLKLLMVPRLAAVLTLVILLMMIISIVTNNFGIESGLSIALFPMVIITMTIERMSIVWDERGATEAINQALGSLLCAALAFLLMKNNYVAHLFTVFPELLLVLLAVLMLLGRYTGYRLLELRRFKALAEPSRPSTS